MDYEMSEVVDVMLTKIVELAQEVGVLTAQREEYRLKWTQSSAALANLRVEKEAAGK
jgi:hypothetical protein